MSKFIVASLASVLALTAGGAVFADPATPAAPDTQPAATTAAADPTAQSPAPAAAAQPAPAPVAKKKGPSPSDVICKPDSGTGSRVGGMKICLTREQWKQRDD